MLGSEIPIMKSLSIQSNIKQNVFLQAFLNQISFLGSCEFSTANLAETGFLLPTSMLNHNIESYLRVQAFKMDPILY